MATVEQVAKAALSRILVRGAEASFEPDELTDFIFAMNNFMAQLDADGVQLGYTVVTNIQDQVTIPDGALRGLIANMAIEVAPDYGGVVTDALAEAAGKGMVTMRKIGQTMPTSQFPSTLPTGSGNYYNGWIGRNTFYPGSDAEILAETTGSISLESGT
jgi:hypothetical protein